MRYADFAPLGRRTSRVGLGCGRLVGRSSLRPSARLVETALELGIRYFDVAPSYGMGTAEEVLGEVLGDSHEVVIATKVGIPRPAYSGRANAVRRILKPVLDRFAGLKRVATRAAARSQAPAAERQRHDFSAAGIRRSLETSLEKLRRGSVDVLLAHEPHPEDLCDEVAARFESLRGEGLIGAFGAGVQAAGDRWVRFGSIWQSRWPGVAARDYAHDVQYVWHGAVRASRQRAAGRPVRPAAEVVREVLEQSPGGLLLVSASTPARLRELLR